MSGADSNNTLTPPGGRERERVMEQAGEAALMAELDALTTAPPGLERAQRVLAASTALIRLHYGNPVLRLSGASPPCLAQPAPPMPGPAR